MTTNVVDVQIPFALYQQLTQDTTRHQLTALQQNTTSQQQFLEQKIAFFEQKYGCSINELDEKLDRLEIDEHPAWEDSIEWRNAIEQLTNVQISKRIFRWIDNLLTQSTTV